MHFPLAVNSSTEPSGTTTSIQMNNAWSHWSQEFDTLYGDLIATPITSDVRSRSRTLLGYSANEVKREVLKWGRANFSEQYYSANGKPTLTAEDKCRLYCYLNFRSHFHSSKWIFSNHTGLDAPVTIIDMGSGPFTSYFAFIDLHPKIPVKYIAIDHAQWMLNMGMHIYTKARRKCEMDTNCRVFHYPDWKPDILRSQLKSSNRILFNFSYFFANPSLERNCVIEQIANFILDTQRYNPHASVYISYSDSPRSNGKVRYTRFAKFLGFEDTNIQKQQIRYKNRISHSKSHTSEFEYEFFKIDN